METSSAAHHLVANDDLRPQRQHARDVDALLLAAGQLMRIAIGGFGGKADALQHLDATAMARGMIALAA